jgi:hypothetical protein
MDNLFPFRGLKTLIRVVGLVATVLAGLTPTRAAAQPVITEFALPTANSGPGRDHGEARWQSLVY